MTRTPSKAKRSSAATLLVEVGTEELPPRAIARLGEAFATALAKRLSEHALVDDAMPVWYATPRRLAVTIPAVLRRQPDRISERRGPALTKAFDDAGLPTAAATGFARSCGVSVDQLVQNETDKGTWLVHRTSQPGALARDLVPESIESALTSLPVPKMMRWGSGSAEFVRPVHWLVVLHGRQIIRCSIFGVPSSNTSHGHRFMCTTPVALTSADSYREHLKNSGHVIADFSERRSTIETQIKRLGQRAGGVPVVDTALLEIVTGLVEKPYALLGSFEPAFLQIPAEILICAMRDHQKYFHLVDERGQLLPKFIAVSNIRSKQPARVRQGNERVLQAR
ncbi:MAG: glycine--tRNA ligase subunit beta, partial [Arenicellales bacterium]|nr:glycine--tRNA ligase subunit beta [Arenicellales bacterium]